MQLLFLFIIIATILLPLLPPPPPPRPPLLITTTTTAVIAASIQYARVHICDARISKSEEDKIHVSGSIVREKIRVERALTATFVFSVSDILSKFTVTYCFIATLGFYLVVLGEIKTRSGEYNLGENDNIDILSLILRDKFFKKK